MNDKDKKAIDKILWWLHIKSLIDAIRNIYYEYKNSFNIIDFLSYRFNYIYKNIYNLKYHQKSFEIGWIDKFYNDMENMDIQNLYYKLI